MAIEIQVYSPLEVEQCSDSLLSNLLTMPRETDPMFLHLQSCHDINFSLMMLLPNIKWGIIICEGLRTMADLVRVFPMEGGKGNTQY